MDRRHFLQTGLAATAAASTPFALNSAFAASTNAAPREALFSKHPSLTPLRGYAGQDVMCERAMIEGKLPADLRGVFYRNGPGLFERGIGATKQRYEHWFDGDGLVHAWRFTDKGVSHQARFVQTKKFVVEQAANEFLLPAFGTAIKAKVPMRNSDDTNAANTNVVKLGDRLVAMWEGGSGYAMDANTLDTRGVIAWSPELKHMPFSAHPKVEADGTFWNFGTLFGKMVLYHISAKGDLIKHAVFDAPTGGMVHDFAITHKHLVFLLPPIDLNMAKMREGGSFGQALTWNDKGATKVLIVDKDDFSKRRVLDAPPFMVFHFGNAWEENNVIRVDYVRSDNLGVMNEWMPKLMRGEMAESQPSNAAFMTIDLNRGRCDITTRREMCEFPRVDPRIVGMRNKHVFYPVGTGDPRPHFGFPGIMRLDVETGKTDRYVFGDDYIVEEHVVVPKPGSTKEGDGYLVGVGFDAVRQQSFATVFDALDLKSGPRAIVRLPYWTPVCFHGNFYSA
jgi:all-trans-8'-apo-beta-carotenal 15,15'-oxygenase